MLNQIVMVGRLKSINFRGYTDGTSKATIKLDVQRPTKDENGEYGSDLITITLKDNFATQVKEYCTTGDLIGIKGRLAIENNKMVINTERITFLSSKDIKHE